MFVENLILMLSVFFCLFVYFVGGGGWDASHPINEPQCISCGCAPSSQELSTTWLCSLMVLSLNKQSGLVVLAELLSYFLAHVVNVWRSQHNQNYNNKSIINQINHLSQERYNISPFQLFFPFSCPVCRFLLRVPV